MPTWQGISQRRFCQPGIEAKPREGRRKSSQRYLKFGVAALRPPACITGGSSAARPCISSACHACCSSRRDAAKTRGARALPIFKTGSYKRAWLPSQKGLLWECLQAHQATVLAAVTSASRGSTLCPCGNRRRRVGQPNGRSPPPECSGFGLLHDGAFLKDDIGIAHASVVARTEAGGK